MIFNTNKAKRRRYYHTYGRPPPPFSVDIKDAITSATLFLLSAIRIPHHWCPPLLQRKCKTIRFSDWNRRLHRTQRRRFKFRHTFVTILLLPLFLFKQSQAVHIVQGTSYALVKGDQSLDISRQQKYVNSLIDQLDTINSEENQNLALVTTQSVPKSTPTSLLRQDPVSFIADTDSVLYIIDTGANRIVVNDARLLTNLKISSSAIKGIGGKTINIAATGKLALPLRSDDGTLDLVSDLDAVLVPSCPYNLIPPQILVKQMKLRGYKIHKFLHDDVTYIFRYKHMNQSSKNGRTLTVPLGRNGLFGFRTKDGYSSFMSRAPHYCSNFKKFAGASHYIPLDDDDSSDAPPLQARKLRETSVANRVPVPDNNSDLLDKTLMLQTENQREQSVKSSDQPSMITTTDDDFEPLKQQPLPSNFCIPCTPEELQTDPNIAATRRKQLRLLTIHETLGHLSFHVLKIMARCGIIPRDLAEVLPPTCPGCAYGKAHRRQWRYKGAKNIKKIRVATRPGEVISMDQLVSPTSGFFPIHRGVPTTKRYLGATIFVDHFSDYTYAHLMTNRDGPSTVAAKEAFERILSTHGVKAKHYHADNGLFDTEVFKSSIKQAHQTLSFCGVNAHHQNGKAERRIGDVTQGTRTSLLHASHRWPAAIHASLWPSAMKNYINLRNNLPTQYIKGNKIGRKKLPDKFVSSPLSRLSGVENQANLKDFHPFGSPVYVLEPNLQALKAHNKWTDRSRVGIFLCHSPSHSSNVPLILNTTTGNVTPQFHCIYDNEFSTCRTDAKFTSAWQIKAKIKEVPPSIKALVDQGIRLPNIQQSKFDIPDKIPDSLTYPWDNEEEDVPTTVDQDQHPEPIAPYESTENEGAKIQTVETEGAHFQEDKEIEQPHSVTPVTTRSGRTIRKATRFADSALSSLLAYTNTYSPSAPTDSDSLIQPCDYGYDEPSPMALLGQHMFALITTDPDTMTLKEALQQHDRAEFIKAMHKEIGDHVNRKHWKVVPLKNIPSSRRCLPMVWSMKRKINPVGDVTKWKDRLCAGGHRSTEFVDYWDTYSPVVSWQTIRLVFTLAIINNWYI